MINSVKKCLTLEEAGQLINLLVRIGTLLLAGAGLKIWKKQKQLEKKSEYAEYLLKKLETLAPDLKEWLKNIFRATNYKDKAIIEGLEEKILLERMQNDPYAVSNYIKKGHELLQQLNYIKTNGSNIDPTISLFIIPIEEMLYNKIKAISTYTHVAFQPKDKVDAYNILSEEIDYEYSINKIKIILNKHRFFKI